MAKGKKPIKLKRHHIIASGYEWKLDHLTEDEADEVKHGKKITVKGQPARGERPDFFYWYKTVKDEVKGIEVEVRIYEVGLDFYWNQAKLTKPDHIEIIEKKALEQAYWDQKIKSLPDTKPPKPTLGTIVQERASKWPDVITLEGGALHGQKRPYNKAFAFFMEQVYEGDPAKPVVVAYRYKRELDNPLVYKFDQTF